MVRIWIEREDLTRTEQFHGRIRDLLDRLGVNPDTVVVVKNGEVVTEEDACTDDDELKLLSVVSGG